MDAVRDWMSSPAIVAPETMTLPEARRMLRERGIRRMPVVDAAGRLVGIVTEGDINCISDSHVSDVRDYNLYHRVSDLPGMIWIAYSFCNSAVSGNFAFRYKPDDLINLLCE